jgi:hypothetical protein
MARCCQETNANASEQIALSAWVTSTIRLRGKRSAMWPAGSDSNTTGSAITNPTSPRAVAE